MWMRRVTTLALIAVLSPGCSDTCRNRTLATVDAPSGDMSAVLFQRDCGATTDFSTQVSVIKRGEQPSGGGDLFVADSNHGEARSADWGGPWAEVRWIDPQHLLIRYDAKARVFAQAPSAAGIRVSYAKTDR